MSFKQQYPLPGAYSPGWLADSSLTEGVSLLKQELKAGSQVTPLGLPVSRQSSYPLTAAQCL